MRRAAALCCLAALLVACGGEPRRPSLTAEDLPHAEGTGWTYRVAREGALPATWSVRVEGAREVGGILAQRLVVRGPSGTAELLGRVHEAGVALLAVAYAGTEVRLEPRFVLLPLPFELGAAASSSARVPLALGDAVLETRTTAVGFGSVVSGARRFDDVFRLESTLSLRVANVAFEVPAVSWVAPKVGLVRSELLVPASALLPVAGRIEIELGAFEP